VKLKDGTIAKDMLTITTKFNQHWESIMGDTQHTQHNDSEIELNKLKELLQYTERKCAPEQKRLETKLTRIECEEAINSMSNLKGSTI